MLQKISQHFAILAMKRKISKSSPHSYPLLELKLVSVLQTDSLALMRPGVQIVKRAVITPLANFVTRTPNFNILEEVHYKSHGITITKPSVKQFTVMKMFCLTTQIWCLPVEHHAGRVPFGSG